MSDITPTADGLLAIDFDPDKLTAAEKKEAEEDVPEHDVPEGCCPWCGDELNEETESLWHPGKCAYCVQIHSNAD